MPLELEGWVLRVAELCYNNGLIKQGAISMAEKSNLDRIEKLIVDGQKEILMEVNGVKEGLGQVKDELGQVKGELGQVKEKLGQVESNLKKEIGDIKFQIKTLDTSVRAAHYDIRELDKKIDEHLKQPAH
ncbi:hypothetical protein HZC35_05855 [Candidatus Saganbacteria bacterium]|nr:hypothetical protein [Candidatus Saganbacteria bacterium]